MGNQLGAKERGEREKAFRNLEGKERKGGSRKERGEEWRTIEYLHLEGKREEKCSE